MSLINERLAALRAEMSKENIDAYIIPSSDAHQSEYVSDRGKIREWISGFDGSAGTVVVTKDFAGLWTDNRYFIQAESQLSSSSFELQKIKNRAFPEHIIYLAENLNKNTVVACDGLLFSKGEVERYERLLNQKGLKLDSNQDLIPSIWLDRPKGPHSEIYEHDLNYAGKSRADKLQALRQSFENQADQYFVTVLDDIAWLFNLRAQDVEYNPVFYAYAIVGKNQATLYVDEHKLSSDLINKLESDGIQLKPYEAIISDFNNMDENMSILICESDISMSMYRAINGKAISGSNYIRNAKGVKNEVEISNVRKAMEKDGAALARTFLWLEDTLKERTVKETEVRDQLQKNRSEQPGYVGESFGAIVGYKGNGAIVHYSPEEESCADIGRDGMLLVDSGGQYLDGTTDITRTFHTGTPSKEEKVAFTMVLKGFIALDKAKYPKGTNGVQLDTYARMFLWEQGLNYGHGTGHGVGFLLNVHEGPQGIASSYGGKTKVPFQAGMITSNEPGFYKDGAFGIRIENLILTKEDESTPYGDFLSHETLSLYPIEIKMIEETLMNAREKAWFNRYHQEVYKRVSPLLNDAERKWFSIKCRPLN